MKSYWGVEHGEISKTFIPGHGYVKASEIVARTGKEGLRHAVTHQKVDRKITQWATERENRQAHANVKELRNHVKDVQANGKILPSKHKGVTWIQPSATRSMEMKQQGLEAYAIKVGGRKSGDKIMVVPKGSSESTVNHELAHLKPKRSGYRFQQVLSTGSSTMREEARADMATGLHRSYYGTRGAKKQPDSGYVGAARSEKDRKGYENFENMQNRFNFAHDEKLDKFKAEPVNEYRRIQNKIYEARVRSGKPVFRGNQYVDDSKRRRAIVYGGGAGTAVAASAYGLRKYQKGKKK